jgi:type I restriction enzyme S subunit
MRGIPILVPPLPEQKRIVTKLDKCFEAIDKARANVERNLQNAKELFQSQLDQIFTQKGEGWVEKKLGEECEVLNGFAFKSKDVIESSNTQLLRMGNLYKNKLDLNRKPVFYDDSFAEEYKEYILKPLDLVMSLTGTVDKKDYGFTVKIPETSVNILLNQRIMKVSILEASNLNKSYLHHFLLSPSFLHELYKTAHGTRQANLSSRSVLDLKISFPKDIKKQKEIVNKLDELKSQTQSLESNYQQELDALDELKKSILEKAFNGELS